MRSSFLVLTLIALGACQQGDPSLPDTSDSTDDAALQSQLEALTTRLEELEAELGASYASLQEELAAINGGVDLTDLEEGLTQSQADLSSLGARVAGNESDIQGLGSTFDDLYTSQDNVSAAVTGLEAELATMEADRKSVV